MHHSQCCLGYALLVMWYSYSSFYSFWCNQHWQKIILPLYGIQGDRYGKSIPLPIVTRVKDISNILWSSQYSQTQQFHLEAEKQEQLDSLCMREKENKRERDCVGVSERSRGIQKEKRRKDPKQRQESKARSTGSKAAVWITTKL